METVDCDFCGKSFPEDDTFDIHVPDNDLGLIALVSCLYCLDELFGEHIRRKKQKLVQLLSKGIEL